MTHKMAVKLIVLTTTLLLISYQSGWAKVEAYTLDEAISYCGDLEGNWKVPVIETDEDHRRLVKFMLDHGVSSAWLGWKSVQLQNWTWINSKKSDISIINQDDVGCGNLDHIIGKLYITPCQRKHGYICYYSDNKSCSETTAPNSCVATGNGTYVGFSALKNWYQAYTHCQEIAANLAILDIDTMKTLSESLSQHSTLSSHDLLYIGLSKEKWVPIYPNITNFKMIHSKWAEGRPVFRDRCSYIRIHDSGGLWFSSNCSDQHSIICTDQHSLTFSLHLQLPTEASTYGISGTKKNKSSVSDVTESLLVNTSPGRPSWVIPVAVISSIIILLSIIAITIVIWKVKKQRSTGRLDSDAHERESSTSEGVRERLLEKTPSEGSVEQPPHVECGNLVEMSLLEELSQGTSARLKLDDQDEIKTTAWEGYLKKKDTDLLTENQKKIIETHMDQLVNIIEMHTKEILGYLERNEVITAATKNAIMAEKVPAKKLLDFIRQNSNHDFDVFCKGLYETKLSHVVENLLVTEDDVLSARYKLADYFLREFTEISLYSAGDRNQKVALPKLYVAMKWKYCKEFTDYTQIFDMVEKEEATRIVIDGQPGAGKTTFIKRLCYVWAQSVLHKDIHDKEPNHPLHKYTLVIPIILRLLSGQYSILDIMSAQLASFGLSEVCSIVNLLEQQSDKVLLLLDGFDECNSTSVMSKIVSKEEYAKVLCITTSRPHAIEQLRSYTSKTVEQHIRLCGFSEDQVKTYIKQFCEYHNKPPEVGDELIRTLFNKRRDILEVAKIPIRTEMICIVWAEYGKLGDTISDLFEMFIIHLLTHLDRKLKCKLYDNQQQVLSKNQPLLLKVGNLANKWENNRLCLVYSTQELQECLEEDSEKVIKIGLLVQSHPSTNLQQSKWSFPHLTIQEYFIAYMLVVCNENVTQFSKKCRNCQIFRRCEVILSFLCSKYPAIAETIFNIVLRDEKNAKGCSDKLMFICNLFRYFQSKSMNVILPHTLHLSPNMKVDKEVINSLLETDKQQPQPNLSRLTIERPKQYEQFLDVHYIKSLNLTINDETEQRTVSQKIKGLTQLESLTVNMKTATTCGSDLIDNIRSNNLTDLSVTGPGSLEAVVDNIRRFKSLQQLHVDDEHRYNKTHTKIILDSLKVNTCIKQVSLCVRHLDDKILQEKLRMKVKLRVSKIQDKALREAVRGLDFTAGLYELDLRGNNLKDEGGSLGQLMAKMTALRVLCVGNCTIKTHTVQAMVQTVKQLQVTSGLHTLNMSDYTHDNDNNLASSGVYLGELISLIPDICNLFLEECNLTSSCLAAVAEHLPESTNILTLDLNGNNVDNDAGGVRLLQHMPHLNAIRLGGSDFNDMIPAVCKAVDAGFLPNLHILDMALSKLQPGRLQLLGENLPKTDKLQVLNLDFISGVEADEYKFVYANIPPSLQHINLRTQRVTLDPYVLLENKHHLSHLHKLNIKLPGSDLEMLQELMEQVNPDIHVYSENFEDIWKMYVLDISEL